MSEVVAELEVLQLRAAILRALRKQGAALAYERDVYADACEKMGESLIDCAKFVTAANAEIDRLRNLNTKLMKKCNELSRALND